MDDPKIKKVENLELVRKPSTWNMLKKVYS